MRLLLSLLLLVPFLTQGQTVCTLESRMRLDSILTSLPQREASEASINDLVLDIGLRFLHTPYVEKTLEVEGDEPLVINLTGLDCTTYLESVVTLARMAKLGLSTFAEYAQQLEFLRYRNGERAHYPSRLHYFSDWIYENEQKGILKDITQEIGGKVYANKVGFMSANPQYYPQLSDEAYVGQIREAEQEIATRQYYYLPKALVQSHEQGIQPGDLIAITISMNNLDITHVGIAVEQAGRIHLLHASSASKQVEISAKPLSEYLMSHKSQSGIMVCRLTEPE